MTVGLKRMSLFAWTIVKSELIFLTHNFCGLTAVQQKLYPLAFLTPFNSISSGFAVGCTHWHSFNSGLIFVLLFFHLLGATFPSPLQIDQTDRFPATFTAVSTMLGWCIIIFAALQIKFIVVWALLNVEAAIPCSISDAINLDFNVDVVILFK